MRIWDLSPRRLCRQHLLGEHRELHAIWSILTTGKKGYAHYPETARWKGKLKALYLRHEWLIKEMKRRGYAHRTPLDIQHATGRARQHTVVHSYRQQLGILREKDCGCDVSKVG